MEKDTGLVIFEKKTKLEDVFIPVPRGVKKKYDETPFVIEAILSLEEGHRYAWSFKVELKSIIGLGGYAGGIVKGDIQARLNEVRVEPLVI